MKEFKSHVVKDDKTTGMISELRKRVADFATGFKMPGYDNH